MHRAREALRQCLPDQLKDQTFAGCLKDDKSTKHWLQQLLANLETTSVPDPRIALPPLAAQWCGLVPGRRWSDLIRLETLLPCLVSGGGVLKVPDPQCIQGSVQWSFLACYVMLWSWTPGLVVLTVFGNSVIRYIFFLVVVSCIKLVQMLLEAATACGSSARL